MQTNVQHQSGDQSLVTLIPRVNIHAFCDNQQTAEVMQSASADRRMSRPMSRQLGGIMAAVQVYQGQATPNVLMVESHGSRDAILSELSQLAQVCQATTKVVVIGHINDVILYRELMRQGVAEYLVAPLHQLQVIETIANLYRDPKAEPVGKVMAFVGAKGGVGSSTLAHNIAWQMSKRFGTDTVITDLDLAFGTAGLNFNLDPSGGMIDALGQPDRVDSTFIDRLLTKLGDKLSLLSAPGGVDREFNIEAHAVETILNAVRGSVPCVVVDVPNLWAPWIKHTLVHADQVIITATPELASLRNTKNLVDMLKLARPNDRPPRVVINQFGVPKRPEIRRPNSQGPGIDIACVIPHDPQSFGLAQSNGQMLFEVAPKSKAAEAIAGLAQILAGTEKQVKPAKFSLSPFLDKLPLLRKK
jgi:pilus assembly protein CpaE